MIEGFSINHPRAAPEHDPLQIAPGVIILIKDNRYLRIRFDVSNLPGTGFRRKIDPGIFDERAHRYDMRYAFGIGCRYAGNTHLPHEKQFAV